MKIKHLLLTVVTLLTIQSAFSQTFAEFTASSLNNGQVILGSETIQQDSALATHPILYSDVVTAETDTPALTTLIDQNTTVKFYNKNDKGIIKVEFEQLPEGIFPNLRLWDSQGTLIKHIQATKPQNVINLRTLASGTYVLIVSINESNYSWNIVRE